MRSRVKKRRKRGLVPSATRGAFTLFELILAIGLAAVLLTLIGTAINLYLVRIDADRSRVEEAQIARSVLTMISDDIRAASIYQKQDTSAIAALMAASKPYNVDEIDDPTRKGGAGMGAPGGANKIAAIASSVGKAGSTKAAGGASASATSSSSSSSSGGGANAESDDVMPLGVSGTVDELYVDVTRMPRQEELFSTVTGYTNAPQATGSNPGASGSSGTSTGADVNPPADLKTVHYSVRQGAVVEPGNAAATPLAPDLQGSAGGLVRQEVGRTMRVFGEQSGTASAAISNGVLIAPEVTQLQFRYYDGSQLVDTWDMKELKKLPTAIEISIWLRSNRGGNAGDSASGVALNSSRQYRQVVYLPMSTLSAEAAAATSTDGSSDDSKTSTSGDASAFGDQ